MDFFVFRRNRVRKCQAKCVILHCARTSCQRLADSNNIYSTILSSNTWISHNYHKFHERMDVVVIFFLSVLFQYFVDFIKKRAMFQYRTAFGKHLNTRTYVYSLPLSLFVSFVSSFWIKMTIHVAYLGAYRARPATNLQGNGILLPLGTTYEFEYMLNGSLQTEQKEHRKHIHTKWWIGRRICFFLRCYYCWSHFGYNTRILHTPVRIEFVQCLIWKCLWHCAVFKDSADNNIQLNTFIHWQFRSHKFGNSIVNQHMKKLREGHDRPLNEYDQ